MNDVTRILSAIEHGDPQAAEQLLPLVYDELRKLAAQRLAQEKPGQTLQATALVHEAYLRLVDGDQAQRWDSRGHFFAAAAEAMRRILVENARRKRAAQARRRPRSGSTSTTSSRATEPAPTTSWPSTRPSTQLEAEDPAKAELVKLRYFAGLSDRRGGRRRPRHLAPQRPTRTGPTPGLAAVGELRDGSRPPEPNL